MRKLLLIFTLLFAASVCYAQSKPIPRPGSQGGKPNSNPAQNGSGNTLSFTVKGVTFEMVRVEGGSFKMGSNDGDSDEKPVHTKKVSSFSIGKTEVTQLLWAAIMGSNPSSSEGNNLPVESVSWDDCQEFITRLNKLTGRNFRLPTEAEWEFAARGGNKSRGYKYSGSNNVAGVAWYYDNGDEKLHPVGKKLANELGLCDMSGNVWEWTADIYTDDYSSAGSDSDTRVIRGGGFINADDICRITNRYGLSKYSSGRNLGLRLAL